jgi:release factor glutamine methyltransferase
VYGAAVQQLQLYELLARNGFVAAEEEAAELIEAAGGDDARLEAMVARRLTGEPLAWITGFADFYGVRLRVDPGVYVPRWQTEVLAARAVERLPAGGRAIDLCTGSGALAVVLGAAGAARVVASDLSAAAVACARANGVEAYVGDLFAPLPTGFLAELITAVVPYVPTPDLPLLQRDTFTFEPELFYDGGADGLGVMRRVVAEAPAWLAPGGALLLELGGRQADAVELTGFTDVRVLRDEDGDVRGIEGTLAP